MLFVSLVFWQKSGLKSEISMMLILKIQSYSHRNFNIVSVKRAVGCTHTQKHRVTQCILTISKNNFYICYGSQITHDFFRLFAHSFIYIDNIHIFANANILYILYIFQKFIHSLIAESSRHLMFANKTSITDF